jgi:alpha-tubulin suppressor-like RCC1 family protein
MRLLPLFFAALAFNSGFQTTSEGALVVGWGSGNGTNVPPTVTNAVAIAAGSEHAGALLADGTVAAWGNNSFHQTEVPVGLSNVVAIACGYNHNLALKGAAW